MPELPEVETIVRTLAPLVENHVVVEAQPQHHLAGRRILSLTRAGKFLLFALEGGFLSIHLRMTGKLLWNAAPGPYTRAIFTLDHGTLLFDDVRRFGRIVWSDSRAGALPPLGPEPSHLSAGAFTALLAARRTRIKPLLLDQRFLAGLGNIYADEALHLARIHPLTPAHSLSPARARRLHAAIAAILAEAIAAGGSSISDYVDSAGRPGSFQMLHRVYARAGLPCPRCSTPIVRIVVAQRGTHLCPRCQQSAQARPSTG